jgi:two-component system sensor histidine kinase BaeS
MLRTLRRRLILSHVLPLLVIIPLTGIALVYVLETRVLLDSLSGELTGQAVLIAEVTAGEPAIWTNPARAQLFVHRVAPYMTAQLMLLDSRGRLLASSDPDDATLLGQPLTLPGLSEALAGEFSVRVDYSERLQAEVASISAPVLGAQGQIVGVVRLSNRLASVQERFLNLRYLIAGVLAAELLLGVAVGLVLALDLERPIRRVTQAVRQLAGGQQLTPLPEQGPEEIRSLARTFNALVERLQTLEENRRQLLANLVHELGRPLGALRAAIHALSGGADRDEALRRELLAGMEAELRRLQRLLDDLAELHEQVLGTLELDRRATALGEWLPQVLSPWQKAAQEKGLHWQAAIPTDLPTALVDPDRLGQALGNLLSNAIKYTPAGGTVSTGAGLEDDAIWIRVEDTGPGIAPQELERIFAPFYRGRSTSRFPQGMGLGLTIARDLVVAHGGRLEAESAPGLGSRFTIWVPYTPESN